MVDSSQWMVWLFRPTDAGSSVVDDPTRAPEDICAPEPVSPRAAPAAAKCGACGYQKTLEAGKTHYWSICKLVVDRMQCPAALPVGHKFYTGAGCGNGKCPCKRPYVIPIQSAVEGIWTAGRQLLRVGML